MTAAATAPSQTRHGVHTRLNGDSHPTTASVILSDSYEAGSLSQMGRLQMVGRKPSGGGKIRTTRTAIDSKLRSCDLVNLRVRDVCHGSVVAPRAMVMQQKTQRPVQFEITEQTREALLTWIRAAGRRSDPSSPSMIR